MRKRIVFLLLVLFPLSSQVKHLSSTLEALRESYSELEGKAEGYLSSMKVNKEDHSHVEELLRVELAQHVREYSSAADLLPELSYSRLSHWLDYMSKYKLGFVTCLLLSIYLSLS